MIKFNNAYRENLRFNIIKTEVKDLFGNHIKENKDPAQEELEEFDKLSFPDRLKRLKYINKIYPFGTHIFGSEESSIIFNETLNNYVFGNFISTVILSISFIERRFQEYHHLRFDKRSKLTLDKLLKDLGDNELIDKYFIERIDKLRKYRNPLVHFKDPNHSNSLELRSHNNKRNSYSQLEMDAKESLDMMIAISKMRVL